MGNIGVVCDTCSDANAVDLRQERIKLNSAPIREIKPPFKGLPSLNVMTLFLSFYGYEDEVVELLHLLSKGTTRYYKSDV